MYKYLCVSLKQISNINLEEMLEGKDRVRKKGGQITASRHSGKK